MNNENQINQDSSPENIPKGITRKELLEQLDSQVNYFENLPTHIKFSTVTHADLYYFMLLIVNILKKEE